MINEQHNRLRYEMFDGNIADEVISVSSDLLTLEDKREEYRTPATAYQFEIGEEVQLMSGLYSVVNFDRTRGKLAIWNEQDREFHFIETSRYNVVPSDGEVVTQLTEKQ